MQCTMDLTSTETEFLFIYSTNKIIAKSIDTIHTLIDAIKRREDEMNDTSVNNLLTDKIWMSMSNMLSMLCIEG